MAFKQVTGPAQGFSFTSSVKDDVWLPGKGPEGYEWWYFDALSDDGREAVVIIFLDNFIFSPRYNAMNRLLSSGTTPAPGADKFPAVAFCYYKDGKPLLRCINEFKSDEFFADPEWPHCEIGRNLFRFDRAPYGQGYNVEVNAPLRGGKELSARFEWLSIESDLETSEAKIDSSSHCWNLVASRSDVTGKISIKGKNRKQENEINFRGTGYHDHNYDSRWLPDAVDRWTWGRVHFADATAVFYDYHGTCDDESVASLFLIQNETLERRDVDFEIAEERRDLFGLKYPSRIVASAPDGSRLTVSKNCVVDSSFFYNRFIFDAELSSPGESVRKAIGIGEHLVPEKLRRGLFDRLIDMRIGKNGAPSFLS